MPGLQPSHAALLPLAVVNVVLKLRALLLRLVGRHVHQGHDVLQRRLQQDVIFQVYAAVCYVPS